jgi:uncharacterized membrane protein YgcG
LRALPARVKQLLDPSGASALALPSDPAQLAYLATVASAELARVELPPLPALAQQGCPLAVCLAYLEVCDPASPEMDWYSALASRAFGAYLARLQQVRGGRWGQGGAGGTGGLRGGCGGLGGRWGPGAGWSRLGGEVACTCAAHRLAPPY